MIRARWASHVTSRGNLGWSPRGMVLCASLLAGQVIANDVEPRLYSNVPAGTNFLSLAYANSSGEVSFDSSVPISDADGEVDSLVLGYSRGLNVAGRSGLLTVALPYGQVDLRGLYLGEPASGSRQGWGDPVVRFAVNLHGAPALSKSEFRGYRQKTIIGTSVSLSIPLGRYVEDRLLNVGGNRWSVLGQAGFSHRVDRWTLEGAIGAAWFSDNEEFAGNNTVRQDTIWLGRTTLLYHFGPALWASAGTIYVAGGATAVNGEKRDNRQSNWRTGLALSIPLARRHALQLRATDGITARTGSDFRTYGISYTYTF